MVFLVAGNYIFAGICTIMFAYQKYNKVIMSCCMVFSMICGEGGINGWIPINGLKYNGRWLECIPQCIIIFISMFFLGRHIPKMIEEILQKKKLEKFKQIYDSLDETILNINKQDYSIEYKNESFYKQFREIPKDDMNLFSDTKIFETYKTE